jgi:uncharacterized small protein (DUF1192 family)
MDADITGITSTAINAAPAMIGSIQSWMQFGAFVLLLIAVVTFMWIREGSATSKRGALRDQQITELKARDNEIERTARGVGSTLDGHLRQHDKWDSKSDAKFDNVDRQLASIYNAVHEIDKRIAVLAFKGEYEAAAFAKKDANHS